MSTWSMNTVGSTTFSVPNLGNFTAVLSGYKWTGESLDFSFPTTGSTWISTYGSDSDASELNPWYQLDSGEKAAVEYALEHVYEGIGGLHFIGPVSDDSATVGLLRFAGSGDVVPSYAFAYFPFSDPSSGDVWFSEDWLTNRPVGGSIAHSDYDFNTILHEVGHALGLKHPFETTFYNSQLVPAQFDSLMYTIMSYDTFAGDTDSGAYRYPTTPMVYDVAALEYMYGPSTRNSGNTTHTYNYDGEYWETIVDGGGVDTLVYNSSAGELTRMSLVPGDYCEFGYAIEYYNAATQYDYRTVWIGPSTVIENAVGGPGMETIVGNSIANSLSGNGDNDTLAGAGGNDKLYGNDGSDWLNGGAGKDVLNGGAGADAFFFGAKLAGTNADRIGGYRVVDDSIVLDQDVFKALPLGALDASLYKESANVDGLSTGNGQRLLYDTDSGRLYYDTNGANAGGKLLVATLVNTPNLSSAEFIVT